MNETDKPDLKEVAEPAKNKTLDLNETAETSASFGELIGNIGLLGIGEKNEETRTAIEQHDSNEVTARDYSEVGSENSTKDIEVGPVKVVTNADALLKLGTVVGVEVLAKSAFGHTSDSSFGRITESTVSDDDYESHDEDNIHGNLKLITDAHVGSVKGLFPGKCCYEKDSLPSMPDDDVYIPGQSDEEFAELGSTRSMGRSGYGGNKNFKSSMGNQSRFGQSKSSNKPKGGGFEPSFLLLANELTEFLPCLELNFFDKFGAYKRIIDVTHFERETVFVYSTLQRHVVQNVDLKAYLANVTTARTIQFSMFSFEACDNFFGQIGGTSEMKLFFNDVSEISFRDYVSTNAVQRILEVCQGTLTAFGIRNCFLPGDNNFSMEYNRSAKVIQPNFAVNDMVGALSKCKYLSKLTIDLRMTTNNSYDNTVRAIDSHKSFPKLDNFLLLVNIPANLRSTQAVVQILPGVLNGNGTATIVIDNHSRHSNFYNDLEATGFHETGVYRVHFAVASHVRLQHYQRYELKKDSRIRIHTAVSYAGLNEKRYDCDLFTENKGYPDI